MNAAKLICILLGSVQAFLILWITTITVNHVWKSINQRVND